MYFSLKFLPFKHFNPLAPMSDQDRISPYNIDTISTKEVIRIKKNINLGITSQSSTEFFERIVWLPVRRITNLIWELKGLEGKFRGLARIVAGSILARAKQHTRVLHLVTAQGTSRDKLREFQLSTRNCNFPASKISHDQITH